MTHETIARRPAVLRLAIEAVILVIAYFAYQTVRHLVAANPDEAFGHATSIIRFEQRVGLFFEPAMQGLILDHHWLVTLFNWMYIWGYMPVIVAAALYLYVRHHDFYTRYRNAFLLSGAIGLIIFATLPVAPPRMFPEFGFVDTVREHSQMYRQFQGSELVNEFAAVPSFHFGWILLVGLAIIQTHRHIALRALGVLLPVMMLLTIVFTANHYVIDAVIGGAVVLLALVIVRLAERRGVGWSTFRSLVHRPKAEGVASRSR